MTMEERLRWWSLPMSGGQDEEDPGNEDDQEQAQAGFSGGTSAQGYADPNSPGASAGFGGLGLNTGDSYESDQDGAVPGETGSQEAMDMAAERIRKPWRSYGHGCGTERQLRREQSAGDFVLVG